jgi:hypothetical protein
MKTKKLATKTQFIVQAFLKKNRNRSAYQPGKLINQAIEIELASHAESQKG